MSTEVTALAAAIILVLVLAWPALLAWWRRGVNREASELAGALEGFAADTRRSGDHREIDASLQARVSRLHLPELSAFRLAATLPNATPELIADATARLALRLRRRIAFERKMLARTASGRRRGAIVENMSEM